MRQPRSLMRAVLGIAFMLAGLNHFRQPELYIAIMPPYLPRHRELVALSGYAEVGLGALVLLPKVKRVAGWGLVALLIAVFPANVQMALNPERYPQIPAPLLWLRLPLQAVLILWVLWSTREQP